MCLVVSYPILINWFTIQSAHITVPFPFVLLSNRRDLLQIALLPLAMDMITTRYVIIWIQAFLKRCLVHINRGLVAVEHKFTVALLKMMHKFFQNVLVIPSRALEDEAIHDVAA